MKSINTFILLLILLINSNAQKNGEWEILNQGGNYSAIDFIGSDTGWIAGKETLIKTEDGGNTWNYLPFHFSNACSPEKIDFINNDIGWMILCDSLFKTENGGQSWSIIDLQDSNDVIDICAVDDTILYLVAANHDTNYILKTIDGGNDWSALYQDVAEFKEVSFLNDSIGIVLCKKIPDSLIVLNTSDAGRNWHKTILWHSNDETDLLYNLQIIDASTSIFLAQKYISSSDNHEFFIYTSADTGNSWAIKNQFLYHRIHSCYFVDKLTGYALMNDSLSQSVYKSTNAGLSWEKKGDVLLTGKIFITAGNVGYIPAQDILYRSTYGCETFMIDKFNYRVGDVFFINGMKGFASIVHPGHMATGASLFITSDGAESWECVFWGICCDPLSLHFVDDTLGFLTNYKFIFRTKDGGTNWTSVYNSDESDRRVWGQDISFLNKKRGWIVGYADGAAILGTTDGGENWDLEWEFPKTDNDWLSLYSVNSYDTIAWAVGEHGIMVKYTPQNQWQKQTSITDLPLNVVFFSDADHGWVAGGYLNYQDFQSMLLITNNSGETWIEKRFDRYLINDLYFADSLHGWAVGADTSGSGIIIKTEDGGNNWSVQIDELPALLNGLHFKNDIGWAVGENGLVLRTDNWVDWIDQSTGQIYPVKYKLYQNYPNPFNPVTVISWQLAVSSHVDLSIHNILGQNVATLVSKKQAAGTYKVEWDASGLSSGVYLYSLEARDFIETKKLVLLK